MENKNETLTVLDELNKGATMGMEAINFVSEKVKDNDFKGVLKVEYDKYKDVANKVSELYSHYSEEKPDEASAFSKAMTWYGIQMKTITDDSTSKLSELLMEGTNMGIIKGRKLINESHSVDSNVKNVLCDFVTMQENSI